VCRSGRPRTAAAPARCTHGCSPAMRMNAINIVILITKTSIIIIKNSIHLGALVGHPPTGEAARPLVGVEHIDCLRLS
jgi:hypothetical protein